MGKFKKSRPQRFLESRIITAIYDFLNYVFYVLSP